MEVRGQFHVLALPPGKEVVPGDSLDTMKKRKISCPWRKSIYRSSISRNTSKDLNISFDTENKSIATFSLSLSETVFIFVEFEFLTTVVIVAYRSVAGQRPQDKKKYNSRY
jgi:hypothetical protein